MNSYSLKRPALIAATALALALSATAQAEETLMDAEISPAAGYVDPTTIDYGAIALDPAPATGDVIFGEVGTVDVGYGDATVSSADYGDYVVTDAPVVTGSITVDYAPAPVVAAPVEYSVTETVNYGAPVVAAPVQAEIIYQDAPVMSHGGGYAGGFSGGGFNGGGFNSGAGAMMDGRYGPSMIDTGGSGPASQNAVLHVSKAAVIKLPTDAREVIVSDPETVEAVLRTARQTVLFGRKVGQTNAFFFDDDGNQILNLEIRVEHDTKELEGLLRKHFPNARVEVQSVLGEFILSGEAGSPGEAQAIQDLVRRFLAQSINAAGGSAKAEDVTIANRLAVDGEDQVMLKVRIAEMRRTVVKQLGVDWGVTGDIIGDIGTAATGIAINNTFSSVGSQLGGLIGALSASDAEGSITSMFKAFERHGVMRMLAEPVLTAVTGESASFLAGGEIPIPVSYDAQDNEVTYEYREIGVALDFTPVVIDDGRISLRVSTEVSEISNEGAAQIGEISLPSISKRRANTTVEIPAGGTMAMAGMIIQRDVATDDGLPGVKNLPVLGRLFASADFQQNETELVILVTPYLVKSAQENDFPLPTDGFAPASDVDFYLLGRLQAVYGQGGMGGNMQGAQSALQAPLGFIMD